jgi:hypothetical protein
MTMTASTACMRIALCLPFALSFVAPTPPARAADSQADFKSASAAVEAADAEAGRLRNQWTVTEVALAEARKAADRGEFDKALVAAREAEALAKESIFQATSEREAWKNLEIR